MKQLLLMITVVMGQSALAADKKPLIADPIVDKAIREKLKKPTGKFTEADLKKIKNLNLRDKGLTDIRSLTGLSGLEVLSLGNNKVKDLSVLKHLRELKELRLDGNQLTNIDTLPELDQLGALFLENNAIADLRPILRLKNLTNLSVGGSDQVDFATIWKLNKLEVLSIAGSDLTNQQLAVVANELPNLKHLFVCYNPKISNLLPLATFKKLEIIDVDDRPNLRIQIMTLQKSLPKLKARYYFP
jgi:internalin A